MMDWGSFQVTREDSEQYGWLRIWQDTICLFVWYFQQFDEILMDFQDIVSRRLNHFMNCMNIWHIWWKFGFKNWSSTRSSPSLLIIAILVGLWFIHMFWYICFFNIYNWDVDWHIGLSRIFMIRMCWTCIQFTSQHKSLSSIIDSHKRIHGIYLAYLLHNEFSRFCCQHPPLANF